MNNVMPYEKFEKIMNTILEFDKKVEKLSDVMEDVFMDGYCVVKLGDELQSTLINMLADSFNCWYDTNPKIESTKVIDFITGQVMKENEPYVPDTKEWWESKFCHKDNDISWWLYETTPNSGSRKIWFNRGEENERCVSIETLRELYDYLVENYANNLTT